MTLQIVPTDSTLGAIVSDLDLSALDESWPAIEDAFHRFALLIFPGQNPTAQQQIDFARRFGEIEELVANEPNIAISNQTEEGEIIAPDSHLAQLLRGNEGWHTDSSYMPLAARASVLSAQVVPEEGGETEWADMRAAYDALDAATRERIADLAAFHSLFHSQARIGHRAQVGSSYGFFDGPPPLRPLVKTHPVTGRRALYIGRHAYGIPGLDADESEQLLAELMAHACRPPRVYRHTWTAGDMVIWDNRCTLHRARSYDRSQPRVMTHTRIQGDPATEAALNESDLESVQQKDADGP